MDDIIHTGQVRMRVTGSGNLDLRLIGLYDDIVVDNPPTQVLNSIVMQTSNSRFPHVLANFKEQYAQLEFSIDVIDEYFLIDKIVLYQKPLWSGYPG